LHRIFLCKIWRTIRYFSWMVSIFPISAITFNTVLHFLWSCTPWKNSKMIYKINWKFIPFYHILSIRSFLKLRRCQTFPSPFFYTLYFGHNFLLEAPILIILDSIESLWNALQFSR
jgi:hypothetical protein